MKDLPIGVQEVVQGQQRMQAEMLTNFAIAVVAGLLLVLAVLILLYKRALPPLVNMGSLFLAPLGGLVALWLVGYPVTLPVYIGMLMLIGIVAKNSILLIDFALEEMNKGVDKFEAILDAGPQAAPADRHDDGRDERRHGADRARLSRPRRVRPADGHHRDRRPHPLDLPDARCWSLARSAWRSASSRRWARACAAGSPMAARTRRFREPRRSRPSNSRGTAGGRSVARPR
jgi:hypothetical protein